MHFIIRFFKIHVYSFKKYISRVYFCSDHLYSNVVLFFFSSFFCSVFIQSRLVTSYHQPYREASRGNETCRHTLSRIAHLSIEAPQPPNIAGEWTSQR